jgi:hypothetical protein
MFRVLADKGAVGRSVDHANEPVWPTWTVGVLSYYDDDDENKPVWPTWAVGVPSYYDDDDENKPVWPTWAVGVLSGVRDVETYNRGRPSLRSLRGVGAAGVYLFNELILFEAWVDPISLNTRDLPTVCVT